MIHHQWFDIPSIKCTVQVPYPYNVPYLLKRVCNTLVSSASSDLFVFETIILYISLVVDWSDLSWYTSTWKSLSNMQIVCYIVDLLSIFVTSLSCTRRVIVVNISARRSFIICITDAFLIFVNLLSVLANNSSNSLLCRRSRCWSALWVALRDWKTWVEEIACSFVVIIKNSYNPNIAVFNLTKENWARKWFEEELDNLINNLNPLEKETWGHTMPRTKYSVTRWLRRQTQLLFNLLEYITSNLDAQPIYMTQEDKMSRLDI